MSKVSFFLKRPNAKTEQAIYAYIRLNYSQIKLYTGITVPPTDWSNAKQRVRTSIPNATTYNDFLDKVAADVRAILVGLRSESIEPTPELIRSRFYALHNVGKNPPATQSFFDYWDEWLELTKNEKTESTIKQYRSVKARLERYCAQKSIVLSFDLVDREFASRFSDYLIDDHKMQNGTVWNHINRLKAFMAWAVEAELTKNREHEKVTQKSFNVQAPLPVRLTEEELRSFAEHDFGQAAYLDNARRLFVLQSCLGVRVTDLLMIVRNPAAYRVGNTIQILTQKNRKPVLIPLLPLAVRILDSEKPPHQISDVELNRFLKIAAKRAGLERLITKAEFRGRSRVDVTKPLHESITTHCAKRTFVSLMAARGVSREVLKAVTGNSDRTLERYLHLDETEIDREMQKAADLLS